LAMDPALIQAMQNVCFSPEAESSFARLC